MTDINEILQRETAEHYHAQKQYLSSHRLADFRKCPALYYKKQLGLVEEQDSKTFLLGRAVHTATLEPERFNSEYIVGGGPTNPKTGKTYGPTSDKYRDWLAEQTQPILTEREAVFAWGLATAVHNHKTAKNLLTDGVAEAVVRASYCGEPCQIRMDYFQKDIAIVELKTCADLTWFEKDATRYGYIYQMAFYRAVMAAATGIVYPVYMIAVEKQEPYRVGVWYIEPEALKKAEEENERQIEWMRQCREKEYWPTGYESTRVFDGA